MNELVWTCPRKTRRHPAGWAHLTIAVRADNQQVTDRQLTGNSAHWHHEPGIDQPLSGEGSDARQEWCEPPEVATQTHDRSTPDSRRWTLATCPGSVPVTEPGPDLLG